MKQNSRGHAPAQEKTFTPPSEMDKIVRKTLNEFAREQNVAMAAFASAMARVVDRESLVNALQAEYNLLNGINTPTDPSPATAAAILHAMLDAVKDRPTRRGAA